MYIKDTIVALATPYGVSGVSILRISGKKVKEICKKILKKIPKSRYANYLDFFNILDKKIIDKGIAIIYKKPNSFTGEDILELHCHGSPVLIDILLKNILSIRDVRIANNGEFSQRAFFNNKIDLLQAEGIDDLINSNSEKMLLSSLNSIKGKYSSYIKKLSNNIIKIITNIEIILNSEEEYNVFINKLFLKKIDNIIKNFKNAIKNIERNIVFKEGIKIVISGIPNSGKSSLFNSILSSDRSIVTEFSGTTRDVLTENFSFDGINLSISDTAGIKKSNDKIEKIGILKAWREIKKSNCVLLVTDCNDIKKLKKNIYNKNIIKYLESNNIYYIVIFNKCDINNVSPNIKIYKKIAYINLSAKKNIGINLLLKFIKEKLLFKNFSENIFLCRNRHLDLIKKSLYKLKRSKKTFIKFNNLEILSEDLIKSKKFLDCIVGKFYTDDLLKSIFSNFCFGK
ncbi:tRNA uridine-5-carboxymethylaminomethyl(34) synthesis GTPase MnmE [Buchnera aphidicola (Ceratovacuna keduensis)]|uniref:tRNA uridine-5-carboxymethylaminomethyl(34) synthesis GTPase MnmE n=1 Tax=Buchnera aphidicola TaxID=9 RepID=UPI0031B7EEE0